MYLRGSIGSKDPQSDRPSSILNPDTLSVSPPLLLLPRLVPGETFSMRSRNVRVQLSTYSGTLVVLRDLVGPTSKYGDSFPRASPESGMRIRMRARAIFKYLYAGRLVEAYGSLSDGCTGLAACCRDVIDGAAKGQECW